MTYGIKSDAALMRMSPNKLHNHLIEHLPNDIVGREAIKTRITEGKAALIKTKIAHTRHRLAWRGVIGGLQEERHKVAASVRRFAARYEEARGTEYETQSNDAYAAWNTNAQYEALLNKVYVKLCRYRDIGQATPTVLAREKNLPNSGRSWVDWIPFEIREKFTVAFDRIAGNGGRERVPFERKEYVHKVKPSTRPRKTNRPPTQIEQLRTAARLADIEVLKAQREFGYGDVAELTKQRDALIEALAEAKREKNRANSLKYYYQRQAEMRAWREEQKALGNL